MWTWSWEHSLAPLHTMNEAKKEVKNEIKQWRRLDFTRALSLPACTQTQRHLHPHRTASGRSKQHHQTKCIEVRRGPTWNPLWALWWGQSDKHQHGFSPGDKWNTFSIPNTSLGRAAFNSDRWRKCEANPNTEQLEQSSAFNESS